MKMKFKKTELKGHSKSFHCKIELLNTHTFNLGTLNGQGHDFGQFYFSIFIVYSASVINA